MAARRKPPVKKIKFELTRSSIAGIGVVCFCIFLWMFLLGVWTGQSLMLPAPAKQQTSGTDQVRQEEDAALHIEPQNTKKMK